jgi:endothelin-converting enzyme/putative endopeptidase
MRGRWPIVLVAALVGGSVASEESGGDARTDTARLGAWGIDLTARDESVAPGDDFNRYANARWLDTFEIPADLSSYISFTKLRLEAEEDVRAIVEELSGAQAEPGSLEQKVGDFYRSWMDVDRLNELGAAPLTPHLAELAGIGDREALMHAFASVHATAPFAVGIIPDPADTTRYVAFVAQSGLGMPSRDYYLEDDERFVAYRQAYREYVARVLTLAGAGEAEAKAGSIIELETKLAEVHWTPEDSRDIQKIYNPMGPEQVAELAPQFDWKLVFGDLGLGEVPTFVVAQTTAIASAGKILEETPLDLWKDYLAFHFVRTHAQYLSADFDVAHYEFFSRTLRGTEEQRERWKRGVNQVDGSLGEAIGQIYVQRHFPPEYREQMLKLVANLTAALEERLRENDWMDDETRKQAMLKLSTFEPRIGYPEKWTDYTSLQIQKGKLLENVLAIDEFLWREQVDRLAGPVDRALWAYPPQTVNASYDPLMNQITFPAGILQPPFFDPHADAAVNYGAIGAVIGHEIGHGFDDQGRRFDEKGRIRDWWTQAADERFSERAQRLGAQYDAYSPIEGLKVKGDLTMGENIGDLGGLQMAYAAYHRHLDECCGGEAPVLDGLTGDQRFFLAWAQVWRAKLREDALRELVVTDPHSPPQYRINGVVRNMDAWYEAFGVGEDAALYLAPEERVRIW